MLKVDYETADQQIRTPSYVFDTDVVNARIAMIKKLLGERVSLCYAMKANAFIIDAMQDHIDRYEVCSPGEFRICERAGIPMEKIVMSGVYKAEEDIHRVIKTYGTEIVYTAESQRQFEQIDAAAQEAASNFAAKLTASRNPAAAKSATPAYRQMRAPNRSTSTPLAA